LVATLLFPPPVPEAPDEEQTRAAPTEQRRRFAWLVDPFFSLLRPVFGQLVSSLLSGALGAMTGAMAAEAADHSATDTAGSGEDPVPF
jgi:hypothetical protein